MGQQLSSWSLLDVGVEAGVWPDLYWHEDVLDTRWAGHHRMSVKRPFLVKVHSGILGHEFYTSQASL